LASALGLVLARRPAPAPPPSPAAALAPIVDTVRVRIDSQPRGAVVRREGVREPLGVTPFEMTLEKGKADFDVTLSLDGYASQSHVISADRDRDILVPFEQPFARPPPPPPQQEPPPAPKRASPHKHVTPPGAKPTDPLDDQLM
jgi:hypothetical protein